MAGSREFMIRPVYQAKGQMKDLFIFMHRRGGA